MQDSLFSRAPLLDDLLPRDVSKQLEGIAIRSRYEDAQLIQTRGDAKTGLSIVRKGAVRVGNLGNDGSYLNTSVLKQGQTFGEFTLFAGLPRTHEVIAMGPTTVDEISGDKFMKLFDSEPRLAKALLTISMVRTHALLEFIDDLRRLPLPVHVGKVIYAAAVETLVLNIRQEELAFTFGVSRVSVGKVLKSLATLGLIRLGYGKIHIVNKIEFRRWLTQRSLIAPLVADFE
ncbi:MAG: Crp/Fnr family transcriptional regulator [Pseudomonadales bacterium]|jgi:CRP/FNR family cyclic AMP-dependent transcriptional regulator|tara:strand:+ start:103 stop:795 length:693 start_codon:yes stop_codon:yes gene_type:complete